MVEEYKTNDLILAHLELPDPCPVRIIIHDEFVLLTVGPRDWKWDRQGKELTGCGTILEVGLTPSDVIDALHAPE